ncbi:hypothetical protein AK812_SmicGene27181 [Symbiodinium microadriaticum]|uniref:PH domain-containing protein n=1 Tax=Symbiodinium microadriaticum TaxID=2951 RepID=A0A1Q9D7L9_SYMMI|nr:hypothetical protein AK812_SmicGene27181 [Symbiodinium microadriaticum]
MFALCKCEEGGQDFSPVEIVVVQPTLQDSLDVRVKGKDVDSDSEGEDCKFDLNELVVAPGSYKVVSTATLHEPALRTGSVWYLQAQPGDESALQRVVQVTLSIHINGIGIRQVDECSTTSLAWSPFSLVQACRLHSVEADESLPGSRLFKIVDFHNAKSLLFAVSGPDCEQERAKWVAAAARALRMMTVSLFPVHRLVTEPVPNLEWTKTRLLAGYMLLFDRSGLTTVFCELHAPVEDAAGFIAYEDHSCSALVARLTIDSICHISERLGVDCSCFTLNDQNFAARSVAEKTLWLRAISNVKVKLRHAIMPTSNLEMRHYRAAIAEQAAKLPNLMLSKELQAKGPFLRRCPGYGWSGSKPPADDPRDTMDAEAASQAKLVELQSRTDDDRKAQAAQVLLSGQKKDAFHYVKKDNVDAVKTILESLDDTVRWQDWRDYCGRTLQSYAREMKSDQVSEFLTSMASTSDASPASRSALHSEKSRASAASASSQPSSVALDEDDEAEAEAGVDGEETSHLVALTNSNNLDPQEDYSEDYFPSSWVEEKVSTRPAEVTRQVSEETEDGEEVEEPEISLSQEEVDALKKEAFRNVVQNKMQELDDVLAQLPVRVWSCWENKAGKDLITLSQERGSSGAYCILAKRLGIVQELKKDSFEEREDVWVFLPGEVQPLRATVLEDTPEEQDDVLIQYWDGDEPEKRIEKCLVRKIWG